MSHQRIHFRTKLQFWGRLDQLVLKKEGYGGLTVIGEKEEKVIWRWLESSSRRIAFWD